MRDKQNFVYVEISLLLKLSLTRCIQGKDCIRSGLFYLWAWGLFWMLFSCSLSIYSPFNKSGLREYASSVLLA